MYDLVIANSDLPRLTLAIAARFIAYSESMVAECPDAVNEFNQDFHLASRAIRVCTRGASVETAFLAIHRPKLYRYELIFEVQFCRAGKIQTKSGRRAFSMHSTNTSPA